MRDNRVKRVFHWSRSLMTLAMIMLLTCQFALAQPGMLTGTVTSSDDNTPIIGATVLIEGTNKGTVTDMDGKFTITGAPSSGKLVVSYLGYNTATESIVDGKSYQIRLASDNQVIDDVVVVGYGTMRKKEVTGAVVRVDTEELNKISTADVGTALQGQIAGVNVQASSGAPGETANVQIRGVSSLDGDNSPLYVVDGVPFDSDPGISASEIQSIDVLKDAASAAVYGTRGAAGVILITTKSGVSGAMKVTLDAYYGVQKITSGLNLMDAEGVTYLAHIDGSYTEGSNSSWNSYSSKPGYYLYNTHLIDMIEMDYQPIYNISLNLSGGSKDLRYSVMANYFSQQGVVINSSFERFNIRSNTSFKVGDKIDAAANFTGIISTQEAASSSLYKQVYIYDPVRLYFDPYMDISPTGDDEESDLQQVSNILNKFKETNVTDTYTITGNFSATYKFNKSWEFNSRLGLAYMNKKKTTIWPFFEIYDSNGDLYTNSSIQSGAQETTNDKVSVTWENMLNYSKVWGANSLKVTGVFSAERYTTGYVQVEREDLYDNDIAQLGTATGTMDMDSSTKINTILGMLFRAQYSYDDRYMFSGSIRRDGSSRFSKENRWGYFPSASAGWNVSEEGFFDSWKNTVNSFKLRFSYGTTGNQNITDYITDATIQPTYDYAFGGDSSDSFSSGFTQVSYSNPDIKWETTQQINAGIDLMFFKSRMTFTTDIYQSNKSDMLCTLKIPMSDGSGTSGKTTINVGDMVNQGVEVALSWRGKINKVNYRVMGTFARNINEITKMSSTNKEVGLGTLNSETITYLREGYEAGAYFLYPTDGVVNTDKELEEYQKLVSSARMGDLKYVDSDGDGEIGDSDRVYKGCGAPEAEFGFNTNLSWKNWDFSMNWYISIGNEIYNGSRMYTYFYDIDMDMLHSWTVNNQTSLIPSSYTADNTAAKADIWVEDGTFCRLKNIMLGYTIPQKSVKKIGLSNIRVYVAADNLLTLTKYTGYDPEVGNDGLSTRGLDDANYPIAAQVRGGIQVKF